MSHNSVGLELANNVFHLYSLGQDNGNELFTNVK